MFDAKIIDIIWNWIFIQCIIDKNVEHTSAHNVRAKEVDEIIQTYRNICQQCIDLHFEGVFLRHSNWAPAGQSSRTTIYLQGEDESAVRKAAEYLRVLMMHSSGKLSAVNQESLFETQSFKPEISPASLDKKTQSIVDEAVRSFLNSRSGKKPKSQASALIPDADDAEHEHKFPDHWPANDPLPHVSDRNTEYFLPDGYCRSRNFLHLIRYDIENKKSGKSIDVTVCDSQHFSIAREAELAEELLEATIRWTEVNGHKKQILESLKPQPLRKDGLF